MNKLGHRARALLGATQFADEPSQEDYDRVHAAVTARVAVGVVAAAVVGTVARTATAAAPVAATGAATGAAGGAAAGASVAPAAVATVATGALGVGMGAGASVAAPVVAGATVSTGIASALPIAKVVAWVVAASVTAGLGTGVVAVSRDHGTSRVVDVRSSSVPTAVVARAAATGTAPARPAVVAVPASASAPALAPKAPEPASAGALSPLNAPPAPRRETVSPGFSSGAPGSASSSASLEAEVALIRDARAALGHDDVTHALALLDDHARRFPGGAMSEDRDALQVFATCAAGQGDSARELAVRFLSSHAASPYAASVRASCAAK